MRQFTFEFIALSILFCNPGVNLALEDYIDFPFGGINEKDVETEGNIEKKGVKYSPMSIALYQYVSVFVDLLP